MSTHDYKKHIEPREMEETEWAREEISSHSSLLTNKRLDTIFTICDLSAVEARTNPCIPTIQDYYAGLIGAYNIVFPILTTEENVEISNQMRKVIRGLKSLGDESETRKSASDAFDIVIMLDSLYRILVAYLQKRNYFFRIGKADIKGINEALKVLNFTLEDQEREDEDEE